MPAASDGYPGQGHHGRQGQHRQAQGRQDQRPRHGLQGRPAQHRAQGQAVADRIGEGDHAQHGHGGPREDQRLPRLDPGDALWQSIGPQRVVGGVTSTACTLVAPGVVEVKGGPRALTLGEPDGSDSARLRALAALLGQAGFPVETTPRIRDAIWSKLMLNLGSGPLAVLALAPLKDLFADQVLVDARFRILAEVGAIAEAAGCRVQVDFSAQMAFARGSSHLPSIAQDVAAGRQPEIETMFRAPLQMAREHGVATPTLDLLVALCTLKTRAMGLCA